MAAYAFARLRWPGRNKVFGLFLATMMVPPIFTALPNFLMIKNLGLLNTFAGLTLPFLFMTPFAIFFLRQFFLSMSREVEEAAMLDGAKHLRIFFQIVLPNAAAPLATLALLTFIGQWNEYFWPLLVGQDENVRVLTVGLGGRRQGAARRSPSLRPHSRRRKSVIWKQPRKAAPSSKQRAPPGRALRWIGLPRSGMAPSPIRSPSPSRRRAMASQSSRR